jgi:hypothetical protein
MAKTQRSTQTVANRQLVERQFWQHLSCQQKNIFLTKYLDGQLIRPFGLKAFRSYQLFKLRFLETTKTLEGMGDGLSSEDDEALG